MMNYPDLRRRRRVGAGLGLASMKCDEPKGFVICPESQRHSCRLGLEIADATVLPVNEPI
jgi:hypothetical protein